MQWHGQQSFQDEFASLMNVSLQREEQELLADQSVRLERSDQRVARLRELAAAWAPFDRRIYLRRIAN
eukprot:5277165-Pyramimonas_sp.AAC.1